MALSAWAGAPVAAQTADDDQEYEEYEEYDETPEVHAWLRAAGGDAVDVHLYDDRGTEIELFVVHAAAALAPGAPVHVNVDPFDSYSASGQLRGRLAHREGDALVWSPDTAELLDNISYLGYEEVDLVVCAPTIERAFHADPPPLDREWLDIDGFECPGWHLSSQGPPLDLTVTLRPDGARYTRGLVASLALAMAGLAAVAAGVALVLRRRLLRTLTGPTTAVGLTAAGAAVMAVPVTAAVIAGLDRPVVNWVMANDLSCPGRCSPPSPRLGWPPCRRWASR